MSKPDETIEHCGTELKPQHEMTNSPTISGGGSCRSPSVRNNDKRFQHYTSDYFTTDLRRSKSTLDKLTEHHTIENWCVYRVPCKLRNVNAAAYTPQLLSIGLFHYGKPELKDMEEHKRIYSDNFRKRCSERKDKLPETKKAVDELRNFVNVSRESIFCCYAGTIDLDVSEDQLVEIILVDACFIIELFLRNRETEWDGKDYILSSPWLKKAIQLELILFENQLPYSLLQDIYEHVFPPSSSSLPQKQAHEHDLAIDIADEAKPIQAVSSFLKLTCEFFKDFNGELAKDGLQLQPKHFTDLVRHFMLPEDRLEMTWGKTTNSKYNITMLTAAGINFMPGEDRERLVVKIDDSHAPERLNEKTASKLKLNLARFRSMNLKITPFCVKDETECIIRNVMALEQFVYPQEAYVCNYILMMDKLVDTLEDVDFLVEKGVIVNMLGSNLAVVKLVNKLCDHIMDDKSCYTNICHKLNRRYECSVNRHLVSLKRVYFKDVWTGSATFFGVVLVVLSIVQIIMSFKK